MCGNIGVYATILYVDFHDRFSAGNGLSEQVSLYTFQDANKYMSVVFISTEFYLDYFISPTGRCSDPDMLGIWQNSGV